MATPDQADGITVNVEVSPRFTKRMKLLAKRYRNIQKDIRPVIQEITKGIFKGSQIPGSGYVVYKVRVTNSDIQKGKSAGYRLIYQIQSATNVLLLSIYSKSDADDISTLVIRKIIAEYESIEE